MIGRTLLSLVLASLAVAPIQVDAAELDPCLVPGACIPTFENLDGLLNQDPDVPGERVGEVSSDTSWAYSGFDNYGWRHVHSDGSQHFHYKGSLELTASIGLVESHSSWLQEQSITAAEQNPEYMREHWNCTDDNGIWGNSSCSSGWQSETHPATGGSSAAIATYLHEDDSKYWYDYYYAIQIGGQIAQTRKLSSAVFTCILETVPRCKFPWNIQP